MGFVGFQERLVGDVERVGVLHHELATPQDARPGSRLVAVLRLDLVQRQRQILVGRVEVLHQQREHLLVRGPEKVVVTFAVLEPEDAGAVLGPPVRRLVGLAGQQRGEVHLLRAHGVHLLANDPLHVAQHPITERQPRGKSQAPPAGCTLHAPGGGGSAARRPPDPRAGCEGTATTYATAQRLLVAGDADVRLRIRRDPSGLT